MIIARIESLIAGKPMSDALERAYAYVQAGADGIMIHSKDKSGEDIRDLLHHVPAVTQPLFNRLLRAAYPAMMNVARTILENERAEEVRPLCMPIKEILELIPGTK